MKQWKIDEKLFSKCDEIGVSLLLHIIAAAGFGTRQSFSIYL
jgi:hypothetical protein